MIKFIRTLILATALAASSMLAMPATEVSAEETGVNLWAVTIGVANYQAPWIWNLDGFDDNAGSLSQLLESVWGDDHVRTLLNSEATKSNIEETINWLASKEDSDDIVLFYFAGHGVPDYIVPYDATNDTNSFISADELKSWLGSLDSQNVAVIMDACNIGSFKDDLSDDRRVILLSSHADEKSYTSEIDGIRTGLFSYYVLEALNGDGLVDENRDYMISAEEVFKYAAAKTSPVSYKWYVTGLVTTAQNPLLADLHEGEFNLIERIKVQTIPESIPAPMTLNGKEYTTTDSDFLVAPDSTNQIELEPVVDNGNGIRYVFNTWQDGNTSTSSQVFRGGTYTATYERQYELSIDSGHGSFEGGGWYDAGANAVISTTLSDTVAERNIFTGWTGDVTSQHLTLTLTMDSPLYIKANWRTEYLLEVESAYGEAEGTGWYQSGSSVTVSVQPDQGILVRQIFDGWNGDISADSAEATIVLDSPKTIKANWKTDYSRLLIAIGGLAILCLAVYVLIKARKVETPA